MLRVFLAGPPGADRANPWVRYAADGRPIAHGSDASTRWPADADVEVVLAADQVRLIALTLPPMSSDRAASAARYALEDQLATSADESSIALAHGRNGTALAAVTSAALLRAIATHTRRVARIIPESALAPHAAGWTWCASAAGGGFVRRMDGSAFALSTIAANDTLPPELSAALAQAARAHAAPAAVHAAFRCEPAQLVRWSRAAGVPFVSAPPWQWQDATPAAFRAAPDFASAGIRSAPASNRASITRAFRPALILGALALAVHFGGLVVEWSSLKVENWRLSRALVDVAAAAQLPDAASPATAFAAITRQNAQLRHRAAQQAPADALPLLARAAPALAALPPGALRSARYAGNAWTLELGKLDPVAVSRSTRTLAAAGVDALAAPTAAGVRMRLSLAPAAY
jgi:hypothetical protein